MKAAPLLLVLLAACQVAPRSDDFRCDLPADCDGGRTCEDGWCVGTGVTVDAAPPDSEACPPECTECTAGRCVIRCDQPGVCSTEVVCPPDLPCDVECTGFGACAGGIDCSDATECAVSCTAQGSCDGTITCGAGACEVTCTGQNSCGGLIDCDSACRCDTDCSGTNACNAGVSCPGPNMCEAGGECTSEPGPCDSC